MPTPSSTTKVSKTESSDADPPIAPQPPWHVRTVALLSSAVAVVLGLAPHVLHHAGPIAGAALIAGTGGTLLFGVIGLVASVPLLLRVHRKSGGWSVPAGLLALFVAGFALSTFVIGPAIRGDDEDAASGSTPELPGHSGHHQ